MFILFICMLGEELFLAAHRSQSDCSNGSALLSRSGVATLPASPRNENLCILGCTMHYSYSHVAGRLLQPPQRQDRIPLRRSNGAVCMGDVLSFSFFSLPFPRGRRFVMLMLYSSYISVIYNGRGSIIASCRRVTKAISSDLLPAVTVDFPEASFRRCILENDYRVR